MPRISKFVIGKPTTYRKSKFQVINVDILRNWAFKEQKLLPEAANSRSDYRLCGLTVLCCFNTQSVDYRADRAEGGCAMQRGLPPSLKFVRW